MEKNTSQNGSNKKEKNMKSGKDSQDNKIPVLIFQVQTLPNADHTKKMIQTLSKLLTGFFKQHEQMSGDRFSFLLVPKDIRPINIVDLIRILQNAVNSLGLQVNGIDKIPDLITEVDDLRRKTLGRIGSIKTEHDLILNDIHKKTEIMDKFAERLRNLERKILNLGGDISPLTTFG